jgi:hypothetical protein
MISLKQKPLKRVILKVAVWIKAKSRLHPAQTYSEINTLK